jgi:hypothetical protein
MYGPHEFNDVPYTEMQTADPLVTLDVENAVEKLERYKLPRILAEVITGGGKILNFRI